MQKLKVIKFDESLTIVPQRYRRKDPKAGESVIEFLSIQRPDSLKLILSFLHQRDINALVLVSKCIYYFWLFNTSFPVLQTNDSCKWIEKCQRYIGITELKILKPIDLWIEKQLKNKGFFLKRIKL